MVFISIEVTHGSIIYVLTCVCVCDIYKRKNEVGEGVGLGFSLTYGCLTSVFGIYMVVELRSDNLNFNI